MIISAYMPTTVCLHDRALAADDVLHGRGIDPGCHLLADGVPHSGGGLVSALHIGHKALGVHGRVRVVVNAAAKATRISQKAEQ
jgi:hypothetical protein